MTIEEINELRKIYSRLYKESMAAATAAGFTTTHLQKDNATAIHMFRY